MAGKLKAALEWAGRGFRVFPLQVNSKDPTELAWTRHATTDPIAIVNFWTDPVTGMERDNNIGFLTTDWIVLDVDTKKGKRGFDTFVKLGMDFDTLTVRTAGGGYHLIYKGVGEPVGQSPIGPDIDVRGFNGYVVAAGSVVDGCDYRVDIDIEPADFPDHLRSLLKRPRRKAERPETTLEPDQPEFIELARYWIRNTAPVAVEGQNGDDTTYKVACKLRDFGLSEGSTLLMMLEEWNDRCEPPWALPEVQGKVENAYRYATGALGAASPTVLFGEIVPVDPPRPLILDLNGGVFRFGNMLDVRDIEPRPWIMGTMLAARVVTTLIAAPGGGKSICTLTVAAHLAVGKPFMGHPCFKAGKSIIYDAEDDLKESSRRLNAICDAYGLDRDIVKANISLVSSDELLLRLTEHSPPHINEAHIKAIVEAAIKEGVQMIAIGPLAEVHTANENDPMQMTFVMAVLRGIAKAANCAVLAVHHTAKPPMAKSSAWVGDQYAGRGSSAVPGAARVVLTLFPAAPEDCVDIGVTPARRKEYVRLDDGKTSYSASNGPRWLHWESIELDNGDSVGVLTPHDAKTSHNVMAIEWADILAAELTASGKASMGVEEAAAAIARSMMMVKSEDRHALRSQIQRLLRPPTSGQACVIDGTGKDLRVILVQRT